jgi:protein-L-isoaspartate O-methyltransferase
MVNRLKIAVAKRFPKLWKYKALLINKDSYLQLTGWKESVRKGYPCKEDGSEVPWMNYPMISLLEKRLNKDLTIFEYGSGYSTIFFARLAKSIDSIEYDEKWFELIKLKVPDNAKVYFVDKDVDGKYCRSIDLTGKNYDIVIVDGRDRVNCIKQAVEKLTERGVIILDDSERERYKEGIEYAVQKGFSTLELVGMKPGSFGIHNTMIIYRSGNCFNI